MENKESQILSEIMAMMASIRSQMELVEAKVAELQSLADQEDMDMTPIDLDLDDIIAGPMETVPEPVETASDPEMVDGPEDDDLPFEEIPEPFEEPLELVDEPVEPEPAEEAVTDPETLVEAKPVVAVIDSMTDRQAWRTDMPGSPVRDIRSAISLNDRILFINGLFSQDPMAFQDALTGINRMESLDEVVAYVVSDHPEWDLESEIVYRFMMAVRRKVK